MTDEHFSSDVFRRARRWLHDHYEDPVEGLPQDDPQLAAAVTQIVMLAEEEQASAELLDVAYLQLELRRIERGLRAADRDADRSAQRALLGEREEVRRRLSEAMGATA
jgi:hypothetical protein